MSEWLGKPRINKEEMTKIFQEFPLATKWFIDEKKSRITTILEPKEAERFFSAVKENYGKINPFVIEDAAKKAILKWIDEKE